MTRILTAALVLLTISSAYSQVGTWQSYTDMKNVSAVAISNSRVVAATSGGTFFYDLTSGEYRKYTIVDGLASISLTAAFVDSKGRIFVGASTGHLNMFENEVGWKTIPDIARSTSRPQRGIRVISEHNGLLYIGTDFGITVYDVDADEFRDTYTKLGTLPLNTGVNGMYFRDNTIWVATDAGVAYADLRYENLQDPSQWGSYTTADGLQDEVINTIGYFKGALAAGSDKGIMVWDGSSWGVSSPAFSEKIVKMISIGELTYVGTPYDIVKISSNSPMVFIGESMLAGSYPTGTIINDFLVEGDTLHIATPYGTARAQELEDSRDPWTFQYPNGPGSNQFISLTIDAAGNLWSASGRNASGQGAYMFNGSTWTNFDKASTPEFGDNNILWAASAPNGDVWFGNWGLGLIRRDVNGAFTKFNKTTVASFPGIPIDPNYSPIGGIAVDREGNVWTVHPGATQQMLSRYGTDGTWKYFGDPAIQGNTNFSGITIDEFGNKWINVIESSRRGILIFNENGTLDDQSDDTWTSLPIGSSSELLADDITSIVVDGFGDVWVGANSGIRTIFNPQEPTRVTRTCYNTRCNIEGEAITCLAVDPVNNKWIGTNSGVFVLSNDGSTIINQFNTDNSLLLDNKITSIAVHPTSGVVYIGTNKGLAAYTTPYQQAQPDFTELKIYPNPFKPKSDLEVSIQGLVEESSIKVLSISGNLVKEFTTPGGNIGFWDGKTADGDWAPTGIYYIAAYSADGKKAAVGKVAVVNE